MTIRAAAQPVEYMSEDEFLARIHETPSLEYIDGAVYRKPVAGVPHGDLAGMLTHLLYSYAAQHGGRGGPEIHINFSDEFHRIYRVPDVSWWVPGKPRRANGVGLPPTLAVEIRSPDQSIEFLRQKCAFMLANGVDACWLIDPAARTIELIGDGEPRVLREGERLESSVLQGFALDVSDLFTVLDGEA